MIEGLGHPTTACGLNGWDLEDERSSGHVGALKWCWGSGGDGASGSGQREGTKVRRAGAGDGATAGTDYSPFLYPTDHTNALNG